MQRLDKIVINRLQRRDQSQLAGETFFANIAMVKFYQGGGGLSLQIWGVCNLMGALESICVVGTQELEQKAACLSFVIQHKRHFIFSSSSFSHARCCFRPWCRRPSLWPCSTWLRASISSPSQLFMFTVVEGGITLVMIFPLSLFLDILQEGENENCRLWMWDYVRNLVNNRI